MGAFLLVSHPVRAQTAQQTAMARALFEEGVALADQENWPEAVDRFERAHAIKPTPGITFNLASALTEAGRVIEAGELLENLCRDSKTPADLKRECEAKREDASRKRAFLSVQVAEGASPDARVEVDGQPWPRAAWGMSSPVNPGTHTVVGRLQRAGVEEELTRTSLELSPGERRELRLSFPTEAVFAPEQSAPVHEQKPLHKKPLHKNWMLWAGVSVVVVGGIILVATLSSGSSSTEAPVPGNAGVIRW